MPTRLEEFLEHNVGKYLRGDILSMKLAGQPASPAGAPLVLGPNPPGIQLGGAAYPLLMSVFSGIELLGALTHPQKFKPGGTSKIYFCHFWETYLYDRNTWPKRHAVSEAIYVLVRCAIAHNFSLKGGILVEKDASPDLHLTYSQNDDVVLLDAGTLANDFMNVYTNKIQNELLKNAPTIVPNHQTMTDQLAEIEKEYGKQLRIPSFLNALRDLPPSSPGGPRGASGPDQSSISGSLPPVGIPPAPGRT